MNARLSKSEVRLFMSRVLDQILRIPKFKSPLDAAGMELETTSTMAIG